MAKLDMALRHDVAGWDTVPDLVKEILCKWILEDRARLSGKRADD